MFFRKINYALQHHTVSLQNNHSPQKTQQIQIRFTSAHHIHCEKPQNTLTYNQTFLISYEIALCQDYFPFNMQELTVALF